MARASSPVRPGERGAAIVEAAIATPVITAAIVALVVSAVLWRDHLAVSEAAAVGARAAALHPAAPLTPGSGGAADLPTGTPLVAATVSAALGGVPAEAVERVVVFGAPLGATAEATAVPPGCLATPAAPGTAPCVVLDAAAVADPSLVVPCGAGACPWRDRTDIGVVGVLVRVRHDSLLAGFVPAPTIESVALAPLEGASGA